MIQSPFKSPPLVPPLNALFTIHPQTIPADDEEGNIFLSTAASIAQPPITPLKQPRRVPSNSLLSATVAPLAWDANNPVSRAAAGIKRKSTCSTTSLRQQSLTPLRTSQSAKLNDSGISFDRLAPPLAPNFGLNTPQSKADTDAHLRSQTDTLTRLRLSDQEVVDFDHAADESDCEMDDASADRSPSTRKQPKSLMIDTVHAAKADQEVAEAISPGGHVSKRRARSRPVSLELLECVLRSPRNSPLKVSLIYTLGGLILITI
jgi:mitosis inhibitor protein kinase SWE1